MNMALGPGGHEVRKLQTVGGSTFTLSLPKPWVMEHKLEPRDALNVDWRPSGALRITPLNVANTPELHAFFDHSRFPEHSMYDHLMGAYISGADVIKITFQTSERASLARLVRRFLKSTRGFEIVSETSSMMELRCLLNAGDMPLQSSLNRMYLIVTSHMRDVISVFDGAELEFLQDAEEREAEVDALLYLIERQARLLMDSHPLASKLNVTRTQGIEYANLARSLERMMDHAHNLTVLLLEHPSLVHLTAIKEVMTYIPTWMGALKELMINIRTRDSQRIEHARHELKATQQALLSYENKMLNSKIKGQDLAHCLKVSERIRRMCAYSRDFGEVLLNMKIAAEMKRII